MPESGKSARNAKSKTGSAVPPMAATESDVTGNEARIDALLGEIEAIQDKLAQIPALQAALKEVTARLDIKAGQAKPTETVPEAQGRARDRWPVFLFEWRKSRGETLVSIALMVGLSKSQLSRIENGLQPYTQKVIEGYAEVLGCHPADLFSPPPPSVKAASARARPPRSKNRTAVTVE